MERMAHAPTGALSRLEDTLDSVTGVTVSQLARATISEFENGMLSSILSEYEHSELDSIGILTEVLKGAYVRLDDSGKIYQTWSQHAKAKVTPSSHASDADQLSVKGRLTRVILFSKLGDSTWFQAERYPVSPVYVVPHLVCWAQYRATGRNQGPRGASAYREANPLILTKKS